LGKLAGFLDAWFDGMQDIRFHAPVGITLRLLDRSLSGKFQDVRLGILHVGFFHDFFPMQGRAKCRTLLLGRTANLFFDATLGTFRF
jgi:hypothetical protein